MYSLSVFGLTIYPYGFLLFCGALFFTFWFLHLQPKQHEKAAYLYLATALPVSLLISRCFFMAADESFWQIFTWENIFRINTGGFSMIGALFAMAVWAVCIAKAQKISVSDFLDRTIPAMFAFVFFARLGEQFTTLGISRPLITPWMQTSFLALRDTYDSYLKTWLLEAVSAFFFLALSAFHAKRSSVSGQTFFLFAFLFGTSQIFFESLRYDAHMRFSFISIQQILAAVIFGVSILSTARRAAVMPKLKKHSLCLIILVPLMVAFCLSLEFLIDRSQVNKILLYVLYFLSLSCAFQYTVWVRKKVVYGKSEN